jgi:hypothetical protein
MSMVVALMIAAAMNGVRPGVSMMTGHDHQQSVAQRRRPFSFNPLARVAPGYQRIPTTHFGEQERQLIIEFKVSFL